MSRSTESEMLFERFCKTHGITLERIPAEHERNPADLLRLSRSAKRPDYLMTVGDGSTVFHVVVEVKQIDGKAPLEIGPRHSSSVGAAVRAQIDAAKGQLEYASARRLPAILLVFNAWDTLQSVGTEMQHFLAAMYGDWTVAIDEGNVVDSYHGRNARMRANANTRFSAVGHLRRSADGARITLYENLHAKFPLPFHALPSCIEVVLCDEDRSTPR